MIILRQRNYTLGYADGSGKSSTSLYNKYKAAGGKEKTGLSFVEFVHGKGWKPTASGDNAVYDVKTRQVVNTTPGEGGAIAKTNEKIKASALKRENQRKANIDFAKNNPNAFKDVATKARAQGYNKGQQVGFQQGQQSVGILGGAKNTWGSMNNTQKGLAIGGAAALTLGTGMMIARNRKKRKEAERELELERARNRG